MTFYWTFCGVMKCIIKFILFSIYNFGEPFSWTKGQYSNWFLLFSEFICMKSVLKYKNKTTLSYALNTAFGGRCIKLGCSREPGRTSKFLVSHLAWVFIILLSVSRILKHFAHLCHLSSALRKWREKHWHSFLLDQVKLFLDEWLAWSETEGKFR